MKKNKSIIVLIGAICTCITGLIAGITPLIVVGGLLTVGILAKEGIQSM